MNVTLMEEFGQTALSFCFLAAWRALPLVAVALLSDLLTRRRIAARFHCLLWALVLMRLACPVSLPASFSVHGPVDRLVSWLETVPAEPVVDDPPVDPVMDAALAFYPTAPQAIDDSTQVQYATATSPDWTMLTVTSLWLLTAVGLLFYHALHYARFAFRLRRCPEVTDPQVLDETLRLCDGLGCRRRPTLRIVESLTAPAVFGIWRPTICLPPGTLQTLTPQELRWVLKHEIAHVVRYDSLLLSLAAVVRAVHWFNPLAWLAVARVRTYAEQAADSLATQSTSAATVADYGRLLLRYASEPGQRHRATVGLLFAADRRRLRSRLAMLEHNPRRNGRWAAAIAVPALLLIALSGLTDAETQEADEPSAPWSELHSIAQITPVVDIGATDEATITRTYDVTRVLDMIRKSHAGKEVDAELYLTAAAQQFGQADRAGTIQDGQLTITQTAEQHANIRMMLEAWELTGDRQICVECRIIRADAQVAGDVFNTPQPGTQAQPAVFRQSPDGNDSAVISPPAVPRPPQQASADAQDTAPPVAVAVQERIVHAAPVSAGVISNQKVRRLVQRAQKDPRSNILFAPKVTVFNGQHATLRDEVLRPFVVALHAKKDSPEELDPQIKTFAEGFRVSLRAVLTESGRIRLACQVQESDLQSVKLARLPFAPSGESGDKHVVQVPDVKERTMQTTVNLNAGQSLLLASPGTCDADDDPAEAQATYYVFTPHLIEPVE